MGNGVIMVVEISAKLNNRPHEICICGRKPLRYFDIFAKYDFLNFLGIKKILFFEVFCGPEKDLFVCQQVKQFTWSWCTW